jgi:RimJ/RimL family protein N-acetyltransferase
MVPVPAVAPDVPDVIALIARVFGEYAFVWDPVIEVPDLFRFAEHYAPPYGEFWVVRDAGRVVGSIGVERVDARTAEIHRLYLDAHLRGRGIGRALVEAVLGWCREQGVRRLVLWSDTRFEDSHRLYRRLGFEQLGERTVPNDLNASREYRFERDV